MATVATSLKMFDQMTSPLQQVTQALNLTISAMDRMNNSASKDIKMTNTLNAARAAIQKSNTGLQELASSQGKATREQNNLNNSFEKGSQAANGLMGKVKGLVGGYLGFQAAKQGIKSTIGGAMGLQQQLFTLQGIMGNKDVATAYFDNLQKKANESVFGFEEFAGNARKFMQFTKNTKSLDKLANLSERLTLMDPAQGLEGAGFAMKEAMSGDFTSLKERFGFGKADAEILKASSSMDDFISKFDKLLAKKGFTESMLQQYNKSATAQFDNLMSNIQTSLAESGSNALEILAPVITQLNQAFSNGDFQVFFNSISTGIAGAVNLILWLVDGVQWIGSGIQSNWGIISPILAGAIGAIITLKGAMLAYNIVQGISKGIQLASAIATAVHTRATLAKVDVDAAATASQWGLNAAVLACPLTWLVIIIIAVIAAIIAWSVHTYGLQATWLMFTNFLITAFDTLKICAFMAVYGIMNMWDSLGVSCYQLSVNIQNALGNMKAGGLMIIQNFVNGAIDLINDLINTVNKIPGVSIKVIDEVTFGTEAMAENEAEKAGRNKDLAAYMSQKDAAKKARENNLKNMVKEADADLAKRQAKINAAKGAHAKAPKENKLSAGAGIDLNKWNKAQGPGALSMSGDKDKNLKDANKHLKNMDDKMDVSNEHLEIMRDLAEAESIQNFVTLTPTVQVTTGDIREEADINKIISKIETYMENELVNSAEGVYA
ncbi:hypothetical protein [Clostridium peptidivorans]|uniref:hypothetical protein n=1 Tax=Clostridium peptidivorans TaxID=100174 RepID=UPI000BE2BEDF|nr:hypothetical protein [Clostridium peptidivorans]